MFLLGLCVPAAAQTPPPGRIELSGGALWIASQPLGTRDAGETTSSGGLRSLFTATSTLAASPAVEGRIAVKAARALEIEGSATYARPVLRVQLGSDVENAAGATAEETVQQFTFGGGVNWYFLRRRPTKVLPFVGGAVGYLRHLHAGATLAQTGEYFQVGGGAKLMLTSRMGKRVKGAGIRLDARALVRSKGVASDFDRRRSASLALGASLFVRF